MTGVNAVVEGRRCALLSWHQAPETMDATLSEWYARAEKELHQMVTRDKCAAGADPQGRCPESAERAGASVQSSPKRPTEGLTEDGVVKQVIKENVSFIIWSVTE